MNENTAIKNALDIHVLICNT